PVHHHPDHHLPVDLLHDMLTQHRERQPAPRTAVPAVGEIPDHLHPRQMRIIPPAVPRPTPPPRPATRRPTLTSRLRRVGPVHYCTGPPQDRACTFPRTRPKQAARAVQIAGCIFAALKVLPRSRRTRSSCTRQFTCSQAAPSKAGFGSAGPFTEVFNLSLGSGICDAFLSKAHLPTSAPPSGPGTRPGIRPVIRRPSGRRSRNSGLRFPVAFRLPAFASWAPCPARGFRPHYCRPTATGAHTRRTRGGPWQGLHVPHA